MKFYLITGASQVASLYCDTQASAAADAAAIAKQYPFDHADIRVELVAVRTDKTGILALLNQSGGHVMEVLRTWRLGPRGGLVECPNGE